jgi:hypothetical protein
MRNVSLLQIEPAHFPPGLPNRFFIRLVSFFRQFLGWPGWNGRNAKLESLFEEKGVKEAGIILLIAEDLTKPIDGCGCSSIHHGLFQFIKNRGVQMEVSL